MSKLDELLQQYCPNGVPYKAVGDVVHSLKKETLKKEELRRISCL